MNGDITPNHRPDTQLPRVSAQPSLPPPVSPNQLSQASQTGLKSPSKRRRLRLLHWIIIGIIGFLIALLGGAYAWYQWSLQPAAGGRTMLAVMTDVTIEPGMTPEQIGNLLEEKSLIRSALSFVIYTRLIDAQGKLQSGSYQLTPESSVPQITEMLTGGDMRQLTITFYPGATLRDPTNMPDKQRTDVVTMLKRAGFADEEISTALAKNYDHPLFAGKPASATLEGYIYGETYQFTPGVTVEEILTHTFDIYYQKLTENNIIAGAKKQGLTLYQAITLASIVEREVHSAEDQRQVAKVFYNRLNQNVPLGSDVTFIYAAKQQNKTPTVDFDSPYNTRIHKGLPPGPIAAPGLAALQAVASPGTNDYLYFIAGDDGKTYFARTEDEHQKNIENHCQKLCFE
mgnify:CR=1 FL=1